MSEYGYLPKKTRKYYARLIRRKMDSMGIKNELIMTPTGKKRVMWIVGKDGKIVFENGKPKQKLVDVMIARNIFKNTLKTLLRAGPDAIEAFLGVPSSN